MKLWISNHFKLKTVKRLEFVFRILPFIILIGGAQFVNPENQIIMIPILFFSLLTLFIWIPINNALKILEKKNSNVESK